MKMKTKQQTKTEEFKSRVKELNPDVIIIGEYVNARTKILCECKDCHETYLADPMGLIRCKRTGLCPKCSHKNSGKNKALSEEEFISKVKNKNPNVIIIGKYRNVRTKILCKCTLCNKEYLADPVSLMRDDRSGLCPECTKKQVGLSMVITQDEFLERVKRTNPNANVIGKYTGVNDKILCKCYECGEEYYAHPKTLTDGKFGGLCEKCTSKQIGELRKKTHEQYCEDVKKRNPNVNIVGKYTGSSNYIELLCSRCNQIYKVRADKLLYMDVSDMCFRCQREEKFYNNVHNINPHIKIVGGEYVNLDSIMECECNECKEHFSIKAEYIANGKHSGLCSKCSGRSIVCIPTQRTHEEYVYYLQENNIPVIPIDIYVNSTTPIRHKCTKCGNEEIIMTPHDIMSYHKRHVAICQKCSGNKLYIGKNDLWTTHPYVAEMLLDKSIGYNYTCGSKIKVDWICPNCGTIVKDKSISYVVRNGLHCHVCSRSYSFGQRMINAILEVCNIEYDTEKTFDWSDSKRYDIYDYNDSIIEVNGAQHYEEVKYYKKTLDEQIENDKYKMELATQNGIDNYIVVDARKSDFNYIINKLIHNKDFVDYIKNIANIEIENIDWNLVYEKMNDPISARILRLYREDYSIPQISKETGASEQTIRKYLKIMSSNGLCEYTPKKLHNIPVLCINTGEYFNSISAASKAYGIGVKKIRKSCMISSNEIEEIGTELRWRFLTQEEINKYERQKIIS